MIYSLVNGFKNNNRLLQCGTWLLSPTVGIAFLAFVRLLCGELYDRKSGKFKEDPLRWKDYFVCYAITFSFFCTFYIPSFLAIGVGTIVQLVQNGLNNDNEMLLIGVLGTIACSLLMALCPYVFFKPSPEIKDPVNTLKTTKNTDVTQQVSAEIGKSL